MHYLLQILSDNPVEKESIGPRPDRRRVGNFTRSRIHINEYPIMIQRFTAFFFPPLSPT